MKHQTVGLQFDFQKSKRAKPWKTALPIAGVPLLAAVLLLALKPARESLKCLCNLVFAASEAVNAYAYDYFEVSDAASPVLALGLQVTAAAGVLLLAYLRGSKIVPLLAALALAGGEIWFGLTPPAAVNVLIFALLALLALPMDTLRGRLVFLLAVMAVFLTVQLLAPGVRMGVEEASEHVRDRLDAAEQLVSGADYTPQQEPPQTAREENRLDTETAGEMSGDTQNTQDYQHIYEQEQEISRPKRIDYLKIAVLTILILALLTLPFLPFVLFDARRRKAMERRRLIPLTAGRRSAPCFCIWLPIWIDAEKALGIAPSPNGTLRWPKPFLRNTPRSSVMPLHFLRSLHTVPMPWGRNSGPNCKVF